MSAPPESSTAPPGRNPRPPGWSQRPSGTGFAASIPRANPSTTTSRAWRKDPATLADALTREDLYLQTKFTPVDGQDPKRFPTIRSSPLPEQVTQSCAASLCNLRDRPSGSPGPAFAALGPTQTLDVLRAMESLVSGGAVRQLGISNCYDLQELEALSDAARVKPNVVQNRLYAETGYDREIRAFCRDRRIIYQSFWTLTANPDVLSHGTVAGLASKYGRTAAQILFRYLTQRGRGAVDPEPGPKPTCARTWRYSNSHSRIRAGSRGTAAVTNESTRPALQGLGDWADTHGGAAGVRRLHDSGLGVLGILGSCGRDRMPRPTRLPRSTARFGSAGSALARPPREMLGWMALGRRCSMCFWQWASDHRVIEYLKPTSPLVPAGGHGGIVVAGI